MPTPEAPHHEYAIFPLIITAATHTSLVGVLERDAEEEIPKLLIRQLRHSPSPPPESEASGEASSEPTTPSTPTTPRSPVFGKNLFSRLSGGPKSAPIGPMLWQGSEPQVCAPHRNRATY